MDTTTIIKRLEACVAGLTKINSGDDMPYASPTANKIVQLIYDLKGTDEPKPTAWNPPSPMKPGDTWNATDDGSFERVKVNGTTACGRIVISEGNGLERATDEITVSYLPNEVIRENIKTSKELYKSLLENASTGSPDEILGFCNVALFTLQHIGNMAIALRDQ